MDMDTIKKVIQDFFQEGTVTIVGSGLSLAEGIPGMRELARELQAKIPMLLKETGDRLTWNEIDNDLNNGVGLEEALHNTKPSTYIEDCIRKITAAYIGDADKHVFDDVVQNKKALRFSEYLRHFNIRNQGLTVITTNYDRLIEYACEKSGIRVDTLFVGKYLARFEPEKSKYTFFSGITKHARVTAVQYEPKVTVLKPHGCLSWHLIDGVPYSVANYKTEDSLIITPGLNKYREGYSVPFDTHRSKANKEIDNAQRYIIIGYGFGDDHLETHLMQQLRDGKPALILTHSLSAKAESIVKSCKNVTAICYGGGADTKVIDASGETIFSNCNLWDLHEMIREVF